MKWNLILKPFFLCVCVSYIQYSISNPESSGSKQNWLTESNEAIHLFWWNIFFNFFYVSFTKSIVSVIIGQRPKTIFVSELSDFSIPKSDRGTNSIIIIFSYLALNWNFIWTRFIFHLVLGKKRLWLCQMHC